MVVSRYVSSPSAPAGSANSPATKASPVAEVRHSVVNLVSNPVGAFLPPNQAAAEREWKERLGRSYGIMFNHLYTITNMPISRFLEHLERKGQTEAYLDRLIQAFNPGAAAGVMCRTMVSVGWDGTLYDCDFNQMLSMTLSNSEGTPLTVFEVSDLRERRGARIATGSHCFGCTAGAGSSCSGALA